MPYYRVTYSYQGVVRADDEHDATLKVYNDLASCGGLSELDETIDEITRDEACEDDPVICDDEGGET